MDLSIGVAWSKYKRLIIMSMATLIVVGIAGFGVYSNRSTLEDSPVPESSISAEQAAGEILEDFNSRNNLIADAQEKNSAQYYTDSKNKLNELDVMSPEYIVLVTDLAFQAENLDRRDEAKRYAEIAMSLYPEDDLLQEYFSNTIDALQGIINE